MSDYLKALLNQPLMKPIRDVYPDLIDEASPCALDLVLVCVCVCVCVCTRVRASLLFSLIVPCTIQCISMYTRCTFEVQCCMCVCLCVCVCVFTVLFDPELCHVVHKFVYTLYACV